MIHLLILAAALLHLQDPAGDAVGDGTLVPPTAPVYANTSDFDLQAVTVTDAKDLTVRVTMGALSNAGGLPNGFSNPVIEVYLDTASGGAKALLPGSGMAMPPKRGWNVAFRVDGDEAFAVEAQSAGAPATWPRLPVTVELQGTTIVLHSAIPRPEHVHSYAVVGVYDPFRQDGWRPLSSTASPWAFSSATQHVPVVDLLAAGHAAQRRAIDSGALVPYRSPLPGVGWLVLSVLGLATAALGALIRRRVRVPLEPGEASDETSDVPGYRRFLDDAEEARLWPDADPSVEQAAAEHEAATTADDEPTDAGDLPAPVAAELPDDGTEEPAHEEDEEADADSDHRARPAPDDDGVRPG